MNNSFQDERLSLSLRTGLEKIGFKEPTPVQQKVIPEMLADKSVVVQALTGSGKTHAYLVPILNQIDASLEVTQAVITAPSRELTTQLYQVACALRDASGLNVIIAHLSGGTDRDRQIRKVAHHTPQLVISTPGRLADFAHKKILKLEQVATFVIDEADMTLDMGFLNQVDQVAARLPKEVQMGAFSATIPVKLEHFLVKYMTHPEMIVIDQVTPVAPTIENDLIEIGSKPRRQLLYQLLTMGQPYLALVFANTRQKVNELAAYLTQQGLKVAKIHGGITERERRRVIREIYAGQFQYIVASDLAARGLDIEGVSLVVNYEIPRNLEFMIHRIGRTGRNGVSGHAVTLVTQEEMSQVGLLEKMGVSFNFKEIKSGALVKRTRFHRRAPEAAHHEMDTTLRGYVHKEKQSHKPGYKKKIKRAIQEKARQDLKLKARHQARKAHRQRQNRKPS